MRIPTPIRTIGLTGGIGSGKSTVSGILTQNKEFGLVDADSISRSLTAANGLAIPLIREHFGDTFIKPDQSLDRDKMRHLIYTNPKAKRSLESIIHPKVLERIEQELQAMAHSGFKTVFLDIPLLAESHYRWRDRLAAILVIDCSEKTQVQRVMSRSNLEQETILKIIASQASRELRNSIADWVILNDGISLEELQLRVQAIDFYFLRK